jgi:hypothetical protein
MLMFIGYPCYMQAADVLVDEKTATSAAAQLASVLFDSHADLLWSTESDYSVPMSLSPSPIIGQPPSVIAEVCFPRLYCSPSP